MDYRCPLCRTDIGRRRLRHAVVTKMETDCPNCKGRLRLNVHNAESMLVVGVFALIVILGAIAYRLQSQEWALAAFGAAMLGSLAVPVLERVVLRAWPRYAAAATR